MTRRKIVAIVGRDSLVNSLFNVIGYDTIQWKPAMEHTDYDFACWTGGQDINPALYGEKPIEHVHYAKMRDEYEVLAFKSMPEWKPKIGICRGGQLLNVLSGGKLWQDVDSHHGLHDMFDTKTGEHISVTSVHHQMMRPTNGAVILGTAKQAKFKRNAAGKYRQNDNDIEACYYPNTGAFCFQPHPEYGHAPCQTWFARTLKEIYEENLYPSTKEATA